MSGMLAIINSSDEDYQKLIKNIDNCDDAAANMAETMQDNLSGQITALQSALQELAIAFGEILMPYIRKAVSVIQDFVKETKRNERGTEKDSCDNCADCGRDRTVAHNDRESCDRNICNYGTVF